MELSQIRAFTAVVKYKSFTGAAKSLFVSHSTVSRSVSSLEEELGVKLLERDNKVTALTEKGKKFLPLALEMLSLEEEMLDINKDETENYQFYTKKYRNFL